MLEAISFSQHAWLESVKALLGNDRTTLRKRTKRKEVKGQLVDRIATLKRCQQNTWETRWKMEASRDVPDLVDMMSWQYLSRGK